MSIYSRKEPGCHVVQTFPCAYDSGWDVSSVK